MAPVLSIVLAVLFVVFGGALGCLLQGADRIVSARMQGRKGPSIWQPYCLKIAAHPAITTGIPSTSEKYGVKYVSVVMKEYTAKIQNANIQVSL